MMQFVNKAKVFLNTSVYKHVLIFKNIRYISLDVYLWRFWIQDWKHVNLLKFFPSTFLSFHSQNAADCYTPGCEATTTHDFWHQQGSFCIAATDLSLPISDRKSLRHERHGGAPLL